ncbi:hypothetical protein AAV96_02590, partial [Acinetobacter sp. AG1]
IIVAVVVTIYTAGAGAAAFGVLAGGGTVGAAATAAGAAIASGSAFTIGSAALLGTTGLVAGTTLTVGSAIGAAMVGAAVGSAVSQLAGKAMGVVDHFSWSQVGVSALTAGLTAGVGAGIGQLASKGYSWAQTANNAINAVNAGKEGLRWGQTLAVGAYAGAVSYGSSYIANQVFGNNQSFSWAALGSSVVGSMAGASLGKSGAFNALGKTASPYAYSLVSANAAATIEDKWFGGARPDYLNVSMAAIANTVGTQFGDKASDWLEMEAFLRRMEKYSKTAPFYAMSVDDAVGKVKGWWDAGVDYVSDVVSDYLPNNAAERSRVLMSGGEAYRSDTVTLPAISVTAEQQVIECKPTDITYALGGVRGFNMSVALDNIQQSRMSQTRAELRPLNKLEAFYRDYHIQPFVNGTRTLGHGMIGLAREAAYTTFDVFAKRVNPHAKPESWFFQSLESQGIYSTGKTIVQNVAVGAVDGVLNPFRALARNDYDAFAESLPNFAITAVGGGVGFATKSELIINTPSLKSPVHKLLYGMKIGEELPGTVGVPIMNRPSVIEIENLTAKHGVEFAVTYKLGNGKNGGGGQYFLHSGDNGSVRFPMEADRMVISHSHPGINGKDGARFASDADLAVLEYLQSIGSPQRSSLIIPVGRDVVVKFGGGRDLSGGRGLIFSDRTPSIWIPRKSLD